MSLTPQCKREHVGSYNFGVYSMGVADKALWQECVNPPTTAEWIARLRRSGERMEVTWSADAGWRRQLPPRPFIRPLGRSQWAGHRGYWWRKLP